MITNYLKWGGLLNSINRSSTGIALGSHLQHRYSVPFSHGLHNKAHHLKSADSKENNGTADQDYEDNSEIPKIEHKTSWNLPKTTSDDLPFEQNAKKTVKPKKMDPFSMVDSIKPTRALTRNEIFKSPTVPDWKKQKEALKKKFGDEGWNPLKKLSREEMKSVRFIKQQYPTINNSQLAEYFKISPEAIRRILRSNWEPKSLEEDEAVYERWKRRGERIQELHRNEYKKTTLFAGEEASRITDVSDIPIITEKEKHSQWHSRQPPRLTKKQKKRKRINQAWQLKTDFSNYEF